jgi:hypothetical protein
MFDFVRHGLTTAPKRECLFPWAKQSGVKNLLVSTCVRSRFFSVLLRDENDNRRDVGDSLFFGGGSGSILQVKPFPLILRRRTWADTKRLVLQ